MFSFTAYGSVMLLGEYGVVEGGWGVCAAVNRTLTVNLKKRLDDKIIVQSEFGEMAGTISHPPFAVNLSYLSRAISHCCHWFDSGFELKITSDIDADLGLGSSAACLVATIGAIYKAFVGKSFAEKKFGDVKNLNFPLLNNTLLNNNQLNIADFKKIEAIALKVLSNISPLASGCDCLASLYGGIICFKPATGQRQFVESSWPFLLIYVGYKTKTVTMLNFLQKQKITAPGQTAAAIRGIQQATLRGMVALKQQNWPVFANIMNQHQHYQAMLGTSDAHINQIISKLNNCQSSISGIKISGSGRGDCLLCLPKITTSIPLNLKQILLPPAREVKLDLQPAVFN